MENKGCTQDGSVDLRGRPVVASQTGRWKACAFLVGKDRSSSGVSILFKFLFTSMQF
jgi:hypothetical protein